MYLLNTEPLTSLRSPLNAVFHVLHEPVPQDAGTPLLLLLQFFPVSTISIAEQDYIKEPPFPHLS
jgi:hypothetical protein